MALELRANVLVCPSSFLCWYTVGPGQKQELPFNAFGSWRLQLCYEWKPHNSAQVKRRMYLLSLAVACICRLRGRKTYVRTLCLLKEKRQGNHELYVPRRGRAIPIQAASDHPQTGLLGRCLLGTVS